MRVGSTTSSSQQQQQQQQQGLQLCCDPRPTAVPHHLQDLLGRWGSLGLDRQQQVFDSALVAAGQGAWAQLEGRLRAALGPSDANAN